MRVDEVDTGVQLEGSLIGELDNASSEPLDIKLESCRIYISKLNRQQRSVIAYLLWEVNTKVR